MSAVQGDGALFMAQRATFDKGTTRGQQLMPCSACGHEEPQEVKKSCNDCEFALFNDYGYSNYTVEGTEFFCTLQFHPADGFDRFYGEDKRLDFAAECVMFTPGDPIAMDVDRYELPDLTPKQRVLFNRRLTD